MTSESSRLHTPAPLERPAWVVRMTDLGRHALGKSHQAWNWSRPRLANAAAATAYHGWRSARRLRLLGRALGHHVMALVNAFDAWWERSTRRKARPTLPLPPPPPAAAGIAPTPVPPGRAATQRPTTGSIARAARSGTGPIARPANRTTAGRTTGSIAKPVTGPLAKRATTPLERTAKPAVGVDDRRKPGRAAAIHCWSCSTVTDVTGARRGGCYYCSRCGKLMTVLDLASGRTRAFTGRGEISAEETEAGDD
jgi:hypothetical protein